MDKLVRVATSNVCMKLDTRSDAELVAATLSGNREAFGQLYDRYAPIVRVVVAGVSGDWPGVEDMVQECFLRGYGKLTTLRRPQRFGPWISGIARLIGRERRRAYVAIGTSIANRRLGKPKPPRILGREYLIANNLIW